MKEKRKKIVARVGAMVAAVLLVVLCALPVFANEIVVPEYEFTQEQIVGYIIETYGLHQSDPVVKLLQESTYDPLRTPIILEFTPAIIYNMYFQNGEYLKESINPLDDLGDACFYNVSSGYYTYFRDIYWSTSHTTNSGNKFVYFDINDGYTEERLQRIRFKINNTTGELLEVAFSGPCSGTYTSNNCPYVIGTVLSERNSDVLIYGLGNEYLRYSTYAYCNYWCFMRGLQGGWDYGYQIGGDYAYENGWRVGYNDGMKQTSLLDGVTAIFRAPMELINSVLNFEILGINMAVAVRVLISMAILGMVITVIWKAVK